MQKVLVTGAYGLVGNVICRHLAQRPDDYEVYGFVRRLQPSDRIPEEALYRIPADRLHVADLTDFAAVQRAVEGMDVVVHMAADPAGRSWESVLHNNVEGTYHVFEACRLAGVRRVVFASTIQVIAGYRYQEPYGALYELRYRDMPPEMFPPITHTQPTRPINLYACSKVWGEALAHTYAWTHGLSCLCVRIGWVVAEDRPRDRGPFLWCSQRDIPQLFEKCINAPDDLRFDIFFGVSDNRHMVADIRHARDVLGYEPQDRAEDWMG